MMRKWRRLFAVMAALAAPFGANAAAPTPPAAAASSSAGNYFAVFDREFRQFSQDGTYRKSWQLDCAGGEPKGTTFGPGGLYVVCNGWDGSFVQLVSAKGGVLKTYSFNGAIGGLLTSGTIRFSPDRKYFYVSAQDGVYRFLTEGTVGTKLIDVDTTALDVMPNGDLLVADGYSVTRYTANGKARGTMSNIADPHDLLDGDHRLVDVRGVAFDPRTNTMFVSMLGYSNFSDQLLAFEGTSNILKGRTTFWYGSELKIAFDGALLVGSRAQAPGIFQTSNTIPMTLTLSGTMGTTEAVFVTSLRNRRQASN